MLAMVISVNSYASLLVSHTIGWVTPTTEAYFSQVWRLAVQDQDAGEGGFILSLFSWLVEAAFSWVLT